MYLIPFTRSWKDRHVNVGLAGITRRRPLATRILAQCLPIALGFSLGSSALANRGAPISEPGLMGRSDIYYFQDFEGDWRKDILARNPNIFVSDHVSFKGTRSLGTRFHGENNEPDTTRAGKEQNGGTLHFWFEENGFEDPEELYFRYYIYIPHTTGAYSFREYPIWDPRTNQPRIGSMDKLPGFSGRYVDEPWGGSGNGLNLPNGSNGWSARMFAKERSDGTWYMKYYVYHMANGDYPNEATARASARYQSFDWSGTLQRGKWHCIEGYIKLNTIIDADGDGFGTGGNRDGILRGWIDGKLAFEKSDFSWRFDERLKIDEVWGNFYIGGSWYPLYNLYVFTDNWVVSKNPIGPYDDTAAPKDDLSNISGPAVVATGETFDVSVKYSAAKNRDLLIELTDGTRSYGSSRVDLSAGSGSISQEITVAGSPTDGHGYKVSATLLPDGGGSTEPLDSVGYALTIDSSNRVNIAPQGTILRSSGDAATFGYISPDHAIDNDLDQESRWSVSGLPDAQFMEIDLGSMRAIDRTELIAHNDRAYQFKVEAKAHAGDSYTLLVDRTGNKQSGSVSAPIQDTFDIFEARYVKLTVTGAESYSGIWASITELRIFENRTPASEPEPEGQPDDIRANVASQSTILSSMGNDGLGHTAAKAIDGSTDPESRWSVSGLPAAQSMEIDLGSIRTIDRTEIVGYQDRAYQFTIEAKANADDAYTLIVDRTANTQGGSVSAPIQDVFQAIGARYVRLTVTGAANYVGPWASIVEFRVFENHSSDADPGPFTGTVNLAHFDNIGGTTLDRLYDDSSFPDSPDTVEELAEFRFNGSGSNYGLFAWAWLVPATTGDYTFWLASDDQGELMLSTSADPAQTEIIASVQKHSKIDQFDRYPEQQSATVRLEAGRAYYIAAAMKQGWGDDHLAVAWEGPGFAREVIPGEVLTANAPEAEYVTGALGFARYDNVPGTSLKDLRQSPKFPASPDSTQTLSSFDYITSDFNYGAYAWAWLIPEASGHYRFWLASDDQGELRLSTDASWDEATVIASVSSHTKVHQFNMMSSQGSAEIYLEAGKAYYIEALVKQGWGGANLSVAWEGPHFNRQIIPGRVLGLPANDATPPDTSTQIPLP